MTSSQLHKILTANCAKILDLTAEIQSALEEYGDDEVYESAEYWIDVIHQCLGEEINYDVDHTITDTLKLVD